MYYNVNVAKQFTYKSYKNKFQDIPAVMDHMMELQNELRRTDLSNLQLFNKTYYIITKNVYAKIGTGFFSEEETMKKLDINFARYYFDALKMYIEKRPTTPAWEIMFDVCKKDESIPFIYLALGVNAHVNNDLGMSLYDVIQDNEFKIDFYKVNPVIYSSINEVISEVRLPKFYNQFMKFLIFHWRNNAWKNFTGLQTEMKTKSVIQKKAYQLAQELAKVKSIKDYYHLYKII